MGFTLNSALPHELVNRTARASTGPATPKRGSLGLRFRLALLVIIGRILHVLRLPVNRRCAPAALCLRKQRSGEVEASPLSGRLK
jgi:hypothetical protein